MEEKGKEGGGGEGAGSELDNEKLRTHCTASCVSRGIETRALIRDSDLVYFPNRIGWDC